MQHSSLLTGSFWVYKLAWNGRRQTLGATKKPKQRDWNLNSQSRKESWNTVSLEECQKMTRLLVRSKFWVRVRVTATRRFVDLNGFAKASTWATCQVSNFSNQKNPKKKKKWATITTNKAKKNCAHLHALGIASKNPGQQGHPESQGLRWSDSIRITTITSESSKKTYASHVSHLWKQIAFNVAIGLGGPFFLRNLMSINMEEKFLPKNLMFLFRYNGQPLVKC